MDPYLVNLATLLHQEDRRRAAERARLAAAVRPSRGGWRTRAGRVLVRAGSYLLDEPEPAPRARVA